MAELSVLPSSGLLHPLGAQFGVFKGPRPFGDALKVIWGKKNFEKNAFFDPKMAQNGHKMAQPGPVGGPQRVNLGF